MQTLVQSSVVVPSLLAGRLFLSLLNLPDVLKYSHQLSSPLTSYSNLREGIYLFQNGIDPYFGGVFRHSPLYLSLFTTIIPSSPTACAVLWTVVDGVGAWALTLIWRARQRVAWSQRDNLVAAMYLLNPYVLLPSLALSTSSIENTMSLLAIMFASQGKAASALFSMALSVQLSLSSILLLTPIILLLLSNPFPHLATPRGFSGNLRSAVPLVGQFLVYFLVLTAAAASTAGGWTWVSQTWGTSLSLPDLTPNPGLWWYFFTEMFDHFRPFFLMSFSVHLLIYVAPVCIKFQHDPLYGAFILCGILATFKSYPTLSDPGLFLSMLSLFPETFPYLRHPIVTALLHLHSALLMPLFHHLWLHQGTGNANFFYASTLVFACSNGAALTDSLWAGMRIALGAEKEGYAIAQE